MPSGMSRLRGEKPNSFALTAWSQGAQRGLSSEIKPVGSALRYRRSRATSATST